MVNSHFITLSDNKLLPHRFFSHGELSAIALFLMVNSHPIALFLMVNSYPIALPYGEPSPHHSFS